MIKITSLRRRRIALAAAALLLVAHRGSPAAAKVAVPAARATCVFANAAYSGKCTETAAVPGGSSPRQACQAILQCLNAVGCLRTYCEATTIRGGWTLESAK